MTEHYTAANTNLAEGAYALYSNESGHDNVAIGPYSLNRNIDGIDNVAVGPDALRYLTTGDDNTAFGNDAGRYIADGETANSEADDCTYIGAGTRASASGVSNETVIGSGAVGSGENTVTIGNSAVTSFVPGSAGTVALGTSDVPFKEIYLVSGESSVVLDAAAMSSYASKSDAIYGLRRDGTSTYTRTGAASGRGFAYSSDEVMGWSDFDSCEPWQLVRVKLHFDPALPKGYEESSVEGAPGWDDCTDDVFVRCPNVYMYESDNGLTGADCTTYKAVSMYPFSGAWRAFSTLVDGVVYEPDCFYIAAFEMSKDESNKGRSLSATQVYAETTTASHLSAARANSAICCLTPDMAYEYMRIMMAIEVGTDNLQEAIDVNGKKLPGFSTGIYSAGKTLTEAVVASNVIKLSTANAATFAVGQSVRISSGWITDVVDTRIIEAIDTTTGEVTLSGAPITCDTGLNVYNMDWLCGSADTILGHTGAKVLGDGRYAMKWRGIEQFYGGSAEAIADLRFKLNDDNTHSTWYCPSLLKADGADAPSAEYLNTGLVSPAADGYVSNLAHAASWPQVAMPLIAAGSSTTYYGDYFYRSAYDNRMPRAGNSWNIGANLGGASRLCNSAASFALRYFAARLSLLP